MALLDLFDSKNKKERLSHIRNLIMVASSDGEITGEELDLIFRIGNKVGITPREIKRILARPESIRFTPPASTLERVEQMSEIVVLMMIDGEIHDNELRLCKLLAEALGFRQSIIPLMINDVVDMIAKGLAIEYIRRKLEEEYS